MRKIATLLFGLLFALGVQAQTTFHDFRVRDIDGHPFHLSSLRGKKVLVVNVASKCGLTPQYAALQELYEKYGGRNFVIIAFPANNFGAQEPGTDQEIKAFCSENYGVTFLVMSKIDVTGADQAPVYQWLTQKSKNGKADAPVQWNFQKFMIDEQGNWIDFAAPREVPTSEKIVNWIENK